MKSMIVIALALTSLATFASDAKKVEAKTEAKAEATCANLKDKELAACEAKAKHEKKEEVKHEAKAEVKH